MNNIHKGDMYKEVEMRKWMYEGDNMFAHAASAILWLGSK